MNRAQQPSINLAAQQTQGFLVTDGAGGIASSTLAGTTAAIGAAVLDFTFLEPRPSANYAVLANRTDASGFANVQAKTTTGFQLAITTEAGVAVDPAAVAVSVEFLVGPSID